MENIDIINTLCGIIEELSALVNKMTEELAQADIAYEVMEELRQRKQACEIKLDVAEYRIRRL